jgi:hypothetical protein
MLIKHGDIPSVNCRGDSLSLALIPPDVDGSGNGRRLTKMKYTDESGEKRECLEMGNGGRSVEVVIRGKSISKEEQIRKKRGDLLIHHRG